MKKNFIAFAISWVGFILAMGPAFGAATNAMDQAKSEMLKNRQEKADSELKKTS